MKKFSKIWIILMILIISGIALSNASLAVPDSTGIILGLYDNGNGRPSGFYTSNRTMLGNGTLPIIKIVQYNSDGNAESANNINQGVYCLKDGIGFGIDTVTGATKVKYTEYFDIKKPDDINATCRAQLPSGSNYRKLMWLLDNICIPSDDDSVNMLLSKAHLSKSDFTDGTMDDAAFRDVIEVIQQAAIWYITNAGDRFQPAYNPNFHIAQSESEFSQEVAEYFGLDIEDSPIDTLYNYLITEPENHADYNYSENNFPITFDRSQEGVKNIDQYVYVGPYKVTANGTNYDNFNVKIINGTSEMQGATIVDGSRGEISGATITDKVKSVLGQNFYVRLPKSNSTINYKMEISASAELKNITLWTVSDPAKIPTTQPVVIIKKENKTETFASAQDISPTADETISIPVKKEWKDGNNQDGIRPSRVIVQLLKNGQETNNEVTLNDANGWSSSFNNLPKSEDGEDIVYTVKEPDVVGDYTSSVTGSIAEGFTVTNTHNTATTSIKVTKVWDDGEHSNERPESVEVELLSNGYFINQDKYKATLNAANGWTHTFDNLPRNSGGTEITYSVREKNLPDGYKAHVTGNNETGLTITNRYNVFDLAFRKYITKVNGNILSDIGIPTRVPNTSKGDYRHRKDPLFVNNGDVITYNLAIYNEGTKGGYATEIVDQLAEGLKYIKKGDTVYSTDANGRRLNAYTVDYDETQNRVTFRIVNSGAKSIEAAGVEYLEVECKVDYIAKSVKDNILTNVAWLAGAYNTDDSTVATDSDSHFENSPNVTKDNIENHKGSGENPNELDNDDYYYKGEEDDDDFEKVYIKDFDLNLKKFIIAVGSKELKTGSTYDRAPVVDLEPLKRGEQSAGYTKKNDSVNISVGDEVTFMIRVYNEGNVSGYAQEIVEHLPPELEFIAGDSVNTQYMWQVDSSDPTGRTLKTNYLSEETDSVGNLLKAYDNNSQKLSFLDIKIKLRVVKVNSYGSGNIAEITETYNDYQIEDSDSNDRVQIPDDGNYKDYTPKEDDEDTDKFVVNKFDLSLKKFVSAINDDDLKDGEEYSRAPVVDVSPLKKGGENANYQEADTPVTLLLNDKVTFTIRVYNEGSVAGYAKEIVEHLPANLQFIQGDPINTKYEWSVDGSDSTGRTIKTSYLSKTKGASENLIDPFDGNELKYKDIQIRCLVIKANKAVRSTYNIAEITESENDLNIPDSDSKNKTTVPPDEELDNYVPQEDDEDVEHITIQDFDLSLKKFISAINNRQLQTNGVYDRAPVVDVKPLLSGQTSASYTENKERIKVSVGDTVTFTIRVYNEGNIAGYAKEITEHLPANLQFIQGDPINDQYMWEVDDGDETGKTVKTSFLSKETNLENIIPGYDGTANELPYKDILLRCKALKPEAGKTLTINVAEISDSDNDKNVPDRDSDDETPPPPPDDDDDYTPPEDDEDSEIFDVVINFDLSLQKFAIQVNDKQLITDGKYDREPKVNVDPLLNGETTATYENPRSPVMVSVGDEITFVIRVYNEGEIAGYAQEVVDHLPDQLEFMPDDSVNTKYMWEVDSEDESGKTIKTSYLSKERSEEENLIKGIDKDNKKLDYKDLLIKCKVVKSETNRARTANLAIISETKNDENAPDRDSDGETPPPSDDKIGEYDPPQDDEDTEKLVVQYFDLSLKKFLAEVNGKALETNGIYNRAPRVDVDPLLSGKTDAKYTYEYPNYKVLLGDVLTFVIRVYNEGNIAGYADEIVEHLPPELEFLPEDSINRQYGWQLDESDQTGKTVKTAYLSEETDTEGNKINGYDFESDQLPYKDIKIRCKVKSSEDSVGITANIAEITESSNEKDIPDIDNNEDTQVPQGDKFDEFEPKEDDEDTEKFEITQKFDLSMKKFVSAVNGNELVTDGVYDRAPKVDVTPLKNGENNANYEETNTNLAVSLGDVITYTIRVYNEGQVPGYAKEIVDYLPKELEFLKDDELNQRYGWQVDETGRIVRTSYLSKARDEANNLIPGYDGTSSDLPYKEVKINCRVANIGTDNRFAANLAILTETENDNNIPDIDSDEEDPVPPGDDYDDYNPPKDDEDTEKVVIQYFDLSLKKFITAIKNRELRTNGVYDRAPKVDVTPLKNGQTNASYIENQDRIAASVGDLITFTIRVYNEGNIAGYAEEILEHLPPQFEFVEDDELNKHFMWELDQSDETGRTVKTRFLSKENDAEGNLINGFDGNSDSLSYKDVQIRVRVVKVDNLSAKSVNIAEITESKNDKDIPDIDNKEKTETPPDEEFENYTPKEDDEDTETLIIENFDLSLKKFVSKMNNEELTSRVPRVDPSDYGKVVNGKKITDMNYSLANEPLSVSQNDLLVYTIRVYNEGSRSGYAAEIIDYIPGGLEFVSDSEINSRYKWTLYDKDGNATTNPKDAVYAVTDYLSKENENEDGENLLKGFNIEEMDGPDYRDVQIEFRVVKPKSEDRITGNFAEIGRSTDENGDDTEDDDSEPNNNDRNEDDGNEEKIYTKYFDLSLRKFLTNVILIEDGLQKEMDTRYDENHEEVIRVELNKTRIENTIVKLRYSIRVENEGEIEGYATEITDYIPNGLKFNQADNPDWKESNGKIYTDKLKDTLLMPGESASMEVILTWVNNEENFGTTENFAEITGIDNPAKSDDIDSVPNNQNKNEDDMNSSQVVFSIVTGSAPKYAIIVSSIIFIIGAGAFIIKKYVI